MLSLCLNNLLPFCCWARKDSQKSECLHKLLLDNADLRPEVRNGIALIIIYVFASAKEHLETTDHAIDMFGVLQDTHRGLGIVHKTSLRIYNDPLNYFSFIKCCITGLIFAHAIPENERQNKPKAKSRQSEKIVLEVDSYHEMKDLILSMLNDNQHQQAQDLIRQILLFWQINKQKVRDTWFSSALLSVKYPNQQQVPSIPPQPRGRQPAATAAIAVAASSRPSPFDPSPRTIHKPQSPPEECFWDVDSCTFDVGLWFDEKSAKKLQNIPKNSLQQQQQQQPQFSSHSLYSDGGNSSFHEGSIGYLGPLPTATPSPPMILSRSNKMSRENSSDYGEGSQMNREKYRESLHHQQHYQSDYSDPDQYDYDATHQHTQPNKIQKVSTTQLYHKPCHGENTSHHHLSSLDDGYYRDTENESDAGSVAGYSSATSGYYLDRTISNCRISDGTAAAPTTTTGNSFSKIPIQHSFSCNNLPGPGIQRSSSFPSSHDNGGVVHSSSSTNTVNSFHIGGHSGQLHHSPRTILTSQEFKQANHQIQSSLATQQHQLHQHNSFPTQQQLHHQQTTHLSPSSITTGSTLISFHQPLQILRFTRISNHVWVLNIDKVYQIESFLQRYFSCVMYLLDEKMIPTEEWTNRKLESLDQDQTINGINDLQVELELRKMFVTSWPPQLHDQLLGFVNNWNSLLQQHAEERKQQQQQQQQQPQRLRDEATTSSSSSAIGCDPHDPPTLLSLWDSGPISLMSRSSNPSSGILAYEISLQHGLVIRSDSTNDENTMWSLIYLHDLLHPSPMPTTSPATWTCYDIFCRIFPQFSAFISHLTEGRDDIANIGIKYCTHSMNSSTTASASATSTGFSFTGFSSSSSSAMAQEGNSSPTPSSPRQDHHRAAPPSPNSSAYQTIGVLSDPASKLIARFQGEVPLFHDILIFPTR